MSIIFRWWKIKKDGEACFELGALVGEKLFGAERLVARGFRFEYVGKKGA